MPFAGPTIGGRTSQFIDQRHRRVAMLGALITPEAAGSSMLVDGLDFVVLLAPVDASVVAAQTRPALVLVSDAAQVAEAKAAGAVEALAVTAVDGATLVGDLEPVRLVTSADAARSAFAAGCELVIYDLPAALTSMYDSLHIARPAAAVSDGREPLVLLSGMLGDQSLWDGVAARLADVVVPWPARIDLDDSVPEIAASVLAAAPARFALAGHSLGAIVALEILRQAPGRVTRAVLVNASARGPSDAQQQTWRTWSERTLAGDFADITAELARVTLPATRRDDVQLVRSNAAMATTVGADGFLRQLAAQSSRPDSLTALPSISVPVLVVSGELDEVCPPALQQELVDNCPPARAVTISGAGHMVPLEDPDALADAIRGWLSDEAP